MFTQKVGQLIVVHIRAVIQVGDSHYRTQETGITDEDTEACVSGRTLGGATIEACDSILVLDGACGLGFELALVLPGLMWLRRRTRSRAV